MSVADHQTLLIVSVQIALQRALVRSGMTQKALAERLGMSPARVSQMLSGAGSNLTLKSIAAVAEALGENFDLLAPADLDELLEQRRSRPEQESSTRDFLPRRTPAAWVDQTANENRYPYLILAEAA